GVTFLRAEFYVRARRGELTHRGDTLALEVGLRETLHGRGHVLDVSLSSIDGHCDRIHLVGLVGSVGRHGGHGFLRVELLVGWRQGGIGRRLGRLWLRSWRGRWRSLRSGRLCGRRSGLGWCRLSGLGCGLCRLRVRGSWLRWRWLCWRWLCWRWLCWRWLCWRWWRRRGRLLRL